MVLVLLLYACMWNQLHDSNSSDLQDFLSIQADLNRAVVLMVSVLPLYACMWNQLELQ